MYYLGNHILFIFYYGFHTRNFFFFDKLDFLTLFSHLKKICIWPSLPQIHLKLYIDFHKRNVIFPPKTFIQTIFLEFLLSSRQCCRSRKHQGEQGGEQLCMKITFERERQITKSKLINGFINVNKIFKVEIRTMKNVELD